MKIAVVEENTEHALSLREAFIEAGIEDLFFFVKAERALEVLDAHHTAFDCVLTDITLPGMNGLTFARKLFVEYPKIRIFTMNGFQIPEGMVENALVGVVEKNFAKPVNTSEMLEHIVQIDQEEHPNLKMINSSNSDTTMPIDLRALQKSETMPFNMYHYIAFKDKTIQLFNEGDAIDQERIGRYLSKGMNHLSALKKDIVHSEPPLFVSVPSALFKIHKNRDINTYMTTHPGSLPDELAEREARIDSTPFFYIKHSSEELLVGQTNDCIKEVLGSVEYSASEKFQILKYIGENGILRLTNQMTEETETLFHNVRLGIKEFVDNDSEAIDAYLENRQVFNSRGNGIVSRSFNVMFLSYCLIKRLEENQALNDPYFDFQESQDLLIYAGATQDIGDILFLYEYLESLSDINFKPLPEYTIQRRMIERSCEYVTGVHFIPPKVIDIVRQHQEAFDGTGPMKLKKSEINLSSQIMAVIDHFEKLMSNPNFKTEECLSSLSPLKGKKYNAKVIEALVDLIPA